MWITEILTCHWWEWELTESPRKTLALFCKLELLNTLKLNNSPPRELLNLFTNGHNLSSIAYNGKKPPNNQPTKQNPRTK